MLQRAKCHLQGQRRSGFLAWVLQHGSSMGQPPPEEGEVAGQRGDKEIDIRLATCVDTFLAPPHKVANPPLQIPLKMIQPQGKTIIAPLSW